MSLSDDALQEQVESALRNVTDANSGLSVFEAGLVSNLAVDDASVAIQADLGGLDPRTTSEVTDAMLGAVRDVDPVESVHVEPVGPDTDDRVSVADVDEVIAVASTKGGVGKSTVAVQLACALAADRDLALFDADIFGPNVPELLDVSGPIHADQDDNPIPVTYGDIEVMSVGLMAEGGPLAWRGAMAHDALSDLFADTAWDDPETLVIDLPPGTSDVLLTTLQEVPLDGVVFVTTPFHTSVADTRRSLRLFRENGVPVLGAVVNMDHFVCEECDHEHDMFPGRNPLDDFDVPVLARLPFSTDLQDRPRPGQPAASFGSIAETVTERLDAVERLEVPEDPVDLRGMAPQERVGTVRERFEALDPGDSLFVVSDRDPTPAGQYLVDLLGTEGDPSEVFPEFTVQRDGMDTWFLKVTRP